MRVGLEVWGADLAAVEATCLRAEAAGIDAFYYGESPGPLNLDCFTVLAHLAARTRRIRLGPVIANALPGYRSTLLLAKQAATLALTSGGRFDLRTGVGAARRYGRAWWEPWGVTYGSYPQRLADLDAFLTEAPALWAAPPASAAPLADGSAATAATAATTGGEATDAATTGAATASTAEATGGGTSGGRPAPGQLGLSHPPVPVTVAATGPRGIELAHRHARVWELSFRTPAEVAGILATHRCPDRRPNRSCPLVLSLEIDGFLASTPAAYHQLITRVAADRPGEDVDTLVRRGLHGTAAEAAARIRELAGAGVDQLVVALHDPHDPDALDTLAEAAGLTASTGDQ